jgi:hypothetical protein
MYTADRLQTEEEDTMSQDETKQPDPVQEQVDRLSDQLKANHDAIAPVVGKIEQGTTGRLGIPNHGYLPLEPIQIPPTVIDAALLAARCAEPLPEDMTVDEARKEIEANLQASKTLEAWCGRMNAGLWNGRRRLQKLITSAPLSDSEYDRHKDDEAEKEAGNE